ncbi:porin [Glaesserella sp.]|uniref:porin n=1 Tax=Glaesserella sp. TaxID=2094731 RepID=UPI00359FC2AB
MKKTLVALAVTAFATSASALTIYENEGSKVDFDGSIRLLLEQNSKKVGDTTTKRAHSNLHNDGSRFGVRMTHNLAEDFFAFGRLEFRFNGGDTQADQFGDLYAHRAYVGLGSKQYGELSFGRQVTIGDDIAQSGFDNAYGAWDTTLVTSGKSVVRYDYKGIEGLQVGVDYRFAEERDSTNGEVLDNALKSGYGAGVIYGFPVAEGQSMKLAAGYTRNNYKTTSSNSHHKDAYAAGISYTIDALTLAADYAGSFEKEGSYKDRWNGFRVGAKYAVAPAIAVYGNYGRASGKETVSDVVTKTTIDKFMLGTEYKMHKNVFTYLEGVYGTAKVKGGEKTTDKAIGVGLRVFW